VIRLGWRALLPDFLPALLLAALAGGCASLPLAPPEAQALKGVWAERRADFPEVRALADVRVEAARGDLWPAFTAVFAYAAPDRVEIAGYTTLGAPLFTYRAEGGRYAYTAPDGSPPRTGSLEGRPGDPAVRLLRAMTHVLDGVLGPETGTAPLRIDRDGRWVAKASGETLVLTADADRVVAARVRRGRGKAVELAFSDFRNAGPLAAPYRIEVRAPAVDARVAIAVADWVLEGPPP
jgi:hypothetical protein